MLPAIFHAGQRLGFDLLPRHYYSEIPDIRHLRNSTSWRRPLDMSQIPGADVDAQAKNLAESMPDDAREIDRATDIHLDGCREAGFSGFGPTEAVALFGFIMTHRPPSIVQVGAGVSTAVALHAARAAGYHPRIVCVDPYPTPFLRALHSEGQIEVLEQASQELEAQNSALEAMSPGSLLFVDSSHTLGPSGEVTRLIGEWLPMLPRSTWVHFHDVYLPFDYHPDVLTRQLFFWHETAAIYLFLCFNPRFEVYYSMSMLHHARPDALCAAISRYVPTVHSAGNLRHDWRGSYPSSLYLRS